MLNLSCLGYIILHIKTSYLRHSGENVLFFINEMPTLRIHNVYQDENSQVKSRYNILKGIFSVGSLIKETFFPPQMLTRPIGQRQPFAASEVNTVISYTGLLQRELLECHFLAVVGISTRCGQSCLCFVNSRRQYRVYLVSLPMGT